MMGLAPRMIRHATRRKPPPRDVALDWIAPDLRRRALRYGKYRGLDYHSIQDCIAQAFLIFLESYPAWDMYRSSLREHMEARVAYGLYDYVPRLRGACIVPARRGVANEPDSYNEELHMKYEKLAEFPEFDLAAIEAVIAAGYRELSGRKVPATGLDFLVFCQAFGINGVPKAPVETIAEMHGVSESYIYGCCRRVIAFCGPARTCAHCQREFTTTNSKKTTCSNNCSRRNADEWKNRKRQAERAEARAARPPKPPAKCIICGNEYNKSVANQQACSSKCRRAMRRKSKHDRMRRLQEEYGTEGRTSPAIYIPD